MSGSCWSSRPSSFPAPIIIGIWGCYYWFTVLWVVIVSSSLLVQLSESFVLSSTTTTFTFTSTRHLPIHHIQQHQKGHFCQTFPLDLCQSVRHVGITVLSNQQQNTIEEKEKSATTKTKRRTWEESFQLLVSYNEKHGNCNVPTKCKEDSRLGWWVITQRRRKDRLSDECIAKLDDLGFSWSTFRTWEESYQLLVSYKEQHGNCNVPYKYKDDRRLGYWVNTQRKRKEKLSDDRIAKLNDLGFSWSNEINEEQWEEMFQKLVQYAKENNGDCNIPWNADNNDKNKELFLWARTQRLRKSLLSEERRTKLDNLGLIWEDADKVKADQKWNVMYESLKDYKEEHGHCLVPKRWEVDPALGEWVSKQRIYYKKGLLREDRQMKLEEIDFTWKVRDGNQPNYDQLDFNWFGNFGKLLAFHEEYGHCDVPQLYKKDKSLGLWVHRQRKNQKLMTLHEDRKERLDDIGFTWSFDDQYDEQWNETYKELKRFKEQNGHLRLPETSRGLKSWVYQQRIQFAAGKVSPERKALLDEIDFRWEIQIQNSSSA